MEPMQPETRQTVVGVVMLSMVVTVAISEGFNGRVIAAYIVSVVGLVAPEALDKLPLPGRREG